LPVEHRLCFYWRHDPLELPMQTISALFFFRTYKFRTLMQAALLLSLLLASALTLAQPRPMVEGRNYTTIDPPLATATGPDIIEMLDVFWYGCPLCSDFEPMMTYWGSQVKGDLSLRRMPAIWNPVMKLHAQVYYTAVQLRIDAQAHPAAFRYIHEQRRPLNTLEQARAFFVELGISAADFEQAWNSEQVAQNLQQAEQKTTAAGITHLPTLVVNGRFRVIRNADVPELPEVVITANQLVKLLRDERRID
jgi:thiol:disulfide interchange protein DsbA